MTESNNLQRQRLVTSTDKAWVEVWQFLYDETNLVGAFVTSNPTQVTFAGTPYKPFPIGRAEIIVDNTGDVQELLVTVCNVDLMMEGVSSIIGGTRAILRIVNTNYLVNPEDCIKKEYKVKEVEPQDAVMLLHLRPDNPLEADFPTGKFTRGRCEWLSEYGGIMCQYDLTRAGAIATCDGTYGGPNGCIVHGDDEVAAGKPRLHPNNFGAFPATLKGPY